MTRGNVKSPNPRNQSGISLVNSKFLSVSSMNTLLAILKVTDARREVILAGGLNDRFLWTPSPPPLNCSTCFSGIVLNNLVNGISGQFYTSAFSSWR